MNKHTPGPWGIEQTDDTNWIGFMRPHDGKVELIVCTTARDFTLKDGAREQNDANARLIAAAPELLDALVEAVECGMVPISSAKDGGASTHSRQVRCADMIRAAIAKATGEV